MEKGYLGIISQASEELEKCSVADEDYARRTQFLKAVIISCEAVIRYATRYAKLAREMAETCSDLQRKKNCCRLQPIVKKYRLTEQILFGKLVNLFGLYSSFCR